MVLSDVFSQRVLYPVALIPDPSFLGATIMSSRAAAVSLWLVPLIVIVASLWWIDSRAGWDVVFAPAAAPEFDGPEHRETSVFALDSSADGDTLLCCLRGQLSRGAPLPARRA